MDNYKSLVSGFISGIVHTIIGYPLDTIKTLKQSNINIKNKNLFNGISYPLIQVSVINSITFGSNNYLKKFNNNYTSNFFTGIITSIITTPMDKYKIMRQYNYKYNINLQNFFKSYKSLYIVSLREVPATFIYFSTYDNLRKNNISIFISGSIAGANSWLLTYPFDTIKTRIQNESSKTIIEAYNKGHLFKGLSFCLIRAFLVNGINFSIYEYCMSNIK